MLDEIGLFVFFLLYFFGGYCLYSVFINIRKCKIEEGQETNYSDCNNEFLNIEVSNDIVCELKDIALDRSKLQKDNNMPIPIKTGEIIKIDERLLKAANKIRNFKLEVV